MSRLAQKKLAQAPSAHVLHPPVLTSGYSPYWCGEGKNSRPVPAYQIGAGTFGQSPTDRQSPRLSGLHSGDPSHSLFQPLAAVTARIAFDLFSGRQLN